MGCIQAHEHMGVVASSTDRMGVGAEAVDDSA
jgi:hypothetical protein